MRRRAALLALALTLASCTSPSDDRGTPGPGRTLKVVFLEDLTVEEPTSMVLPAFQGAKLAFDAEARAGLPVDVELVATEVDLSKVADVARELVADPSVVAVIVGPFLAVPADAAGVLDASGLPVVSLSSVRPDLATAGLTSWFSAVADVGEEARAIAARLRPFAGGAVCLAGDGTPASSHLVEVVAAGMSGRAAVSIEAPPEGAAWEAFAARVSETGCATLFWGGFGREAAQIRLALDSAGLEAVGLVGSEAMKAPSFLIEAGPAGDGTVVACPCTDLTTSTDLPVRRFIQNFQADFGLPPGPYAAEAWDVAHMLLGAFRGGARTRADVLAALGGPGSYQGLAGSYPFGPDGAVKPGRANLFVDEGGRWIPLRPPP